MAWYVYIIQSQSGRLLYTGIALDPDQRLHHHNNTKKGARFTKQDRPWCIVHLEGPMTRAEALKRERAIKRLRRADKLALCQGGRP